ncbi:MAG: HAD family hydrolase [Desulfobacteraceae bacterium]|jgi:putative hydrolase of the HAD superfamily|nr:HAD family hydrolase [Desulfobacteraceae bacterium]
MIEAVIFDFGQTLVDSADGFRTAEKQAQNNLFAKLGLTIREDFLTIYRRLRKEFHERSDFSRNSLWREVLYYYCVAPETGQLEKWETEYWETVKARTTIFPETEEVLESLSDRYEVALITNTQGQKTTGTHRISLFPELEKFFRVIIVAGENGIPAKPDPEPFRLCLEKLNLAAGQAVYVGDDYRIDICGARGAGLHPVWLKHDSVRRNWPSVKNSVPVITNLKQLLELDNIY